MDNTGNENQRSATCVTSTTSITLSSSRPRSRSKPRQLHRINTRDKSQERIAVCRSENTTRGSSAEHNIRVNSLSTRGRQVRRQDESESIDSGLGYSPNSSAHYTRPQTLEAQFRQQFSCPQSTPSQSSEGQQSTTRQKSPDGVAAYVLQPDGTMATVRWDDKSALENNSPLLTVLKQEQYAQMHGKTTGRIQNVSSSKAKLPNDVLNWLAAEDEVYTRNSSSERGRAMTPKFTASSSGQRASDNMSNPPLPTRVRVPRAKSVEYRKPRQRRSQTAYGSDVNELSHTRQFEALQISGPGGVQYQAPKQHFYQPQRSVPNTNANLVQERGRPSSLHMANNGKPEVPRQPHMYNDRPSPLKSPVQQPHMYNDKPSPLKSPVQQPHMYNDRSSTLRSPVQQPYMYNNNNNRSVHSPVKVVSPQQPFYNNNYKHMHSPPPNSSPVPSHYQAARQLVSSSSTGLTSNPSRITSSPVRATTSPARALARAVSVPPRSDSPQAFSYIREPRQLNPSEITPTPLLSSPYVKPKYDSAPKVEESRPFIDPYDSSQYMITSEHNGDKVPRNGLKIIRSPNSATAGNAFNFSTQHSYPDSSSISPYATQRYSTESQKVQFSPTTQEIEENSSANQVKEDVWSPKAEPIKIQRAPGAQARKAAYEQREITLDRVPDVAMQPRMGNTSDVPVWDRFKYYERCAVTDF